MRTARPWVLPAEPTPVSALRAQGVTDEMVRTQLAAGRLVRLRRGVLLAADAWPDEPAAQYPVLARAEQAANPAGVISHESAAAIWDLPTPSFRPWHEAPVSLTFPRGARHHSRPTAEHHVGILPSSHLARDSTGATLTSVARTATDLARHLELPGALVLLDAAARRLCEGFVGRPRRADYGNERLLRAARECMRDAARVRNSARLDAAIARAYAARETAIESLTAGHLLLSGLPEPRYQEPVHTPIGTLFPDFLWVEQRLVGEADGAVKYADSTAYVREKQREQVLRDLGYRMVRWLGSEIMTRPDVVVARIARALDQ